MKESALFRGDLCSAHFRDSDQPFRALMYRLSRGRGRRGSCCFATFPVRKAFESGCGASSWARKVSGETWYARSFPIGSRIVTAARGSWRTLVCCRVAAAAAAAVVSSEPIARYSMLLQEKEMNALCDHSPPNALPYAAVIYVCLTLS